MPPQVPQMNPALAQLSQQLTRMQAQIARLERNQRASQMGNTSIENGALVINDANGNPQIALGLQPDGTFAHAAVGNQVPVAPDQPLTETGILGIVAYWDGLMSDGSAPLADFAGVQVHCSAVSGFTPGPTTLQGLMPSSGFFGIGNLTPGTTYYVCLVAVNAAGNTSPPSAQASAQPSSVPAGIPAGSLPGDAIQTGTLTAAQLAAEAGILGSQIANATITGQNITAGTITAQLIASGTLTAALIAAGTIVAGIVDGTTIEGATIIGTLLETLYDGTPAANNMVYSVNPLGGEQADGHGNYAVPGPAAAIYGELGGVYYAFALQFSAIDGGASLELFSQSSQGNAWADQGSVLFWDAASGLISLFPLSGLTVAGAAALEGTVSGSGGTLSVGDNISLASGKTISVDTWHTITLDSGWTAGSPAPQYRLLPDGNVQLAGKATHTAITTETAVNSTHALGTAYRPASDKKIYQGNRAGGLTGAALDTTGIVYAEPNGTSATTVDLTGITDLL